MRACCSLAIASLLFFAQGAAAQTAKFVQPAEARVVFVRDGVFADPADDAWSEIAETTYTLMPQMITPPNGGGAVSEVAVRARRDPRRRPS